MSFVLSDTFQQHVPSMFGFWFVWSSFFHLICLLSMFCLRFRQRSVYVPIMIGQICSIYIPSMFRLCSVFISSTFWLCSVHCSVYCLIYLLSIISLQFRLPLVYVPSMFRSCSVSYVPSMVLVSFCLLHSGYVPSLIRLHATVPSLFRVCSAVVLALFWFQLCCVGSILAIVLPIFRLRFTSMIRLCSDYVLFLYIILYIVLYIVL